MTSRRGAIRAVAVLAGAWLAAQSVAARSAAAQAPAAIVPGELQRAHAHNDYQHVRPLLDSFERGFASIEADVFLVNGELLVAHARDSVTPERTLERLYLAPLRALVARHGGHLRPDGTPLYLLIDIKGNADSTYAVLDPLLRRYDDLFTAYDGDRVTARPLIAVLSGERPIATVRAARSRVVTLDGRLADLADPAAPSPSVMPLVSDEWDQLVTWRGVGPAPAAARAAVASAVARAHAQGRRLRFWGTPDQDAVWRLLFDEGVDLIGADDLDRLRAFFVQRR